MADRLLREIRQSKPFETLEEEAYLNLVRTANELGQHVASVLREGELTPTQYNALRILRGAGEEGLACSEVGERMVTREPDVTRLLDRLEQHGYVVRRRSAADRRVVEARITAAGRALVDRLDRPVLAALALRLGPLGRERLRQLIDLLEAVRSTG